MTLLAALLAALAVAMACPTRPARSRFWAGGPPEGLLRSSGHVRLVGLVVLVALLALLPVWLSGTRLVLAALVAATAGAVLHFLAQARNDAAAERRADSVLGACDGLAADLLAGEPPQRALDRAAAEWPELASVAGAARLGSDVPAAFRALARQPGAGELAVVAAAWQVAERSGAGLADPIARASRAIREHRSTRRLLSSELAAAHATARLMTVLPFVMLLFTRGIGGDPVHFLTASPLGLACLGGGLALSFLGLLWLDRVARQVLS